MSEPTLARVIPLVNHRAPQVPVPNEDIGLWHSTRAVQDALGRPLRDLRISVTDRCNFRCAYCMPKELFGKDHKYLEHHSKQNALRRGHHPGEQTEWKRVVRHHSIDGRRVYDRKVSQVSRYEADDECGENRKNRCQENRHEA